jgi:hypothetical protein
MSESHDPHDLTSPAETSLRSAPTEDLPPRSDDTRGRPRSESEGLRYRPGDVFRSRYRIVGSAGHGGFSEVYRAEVAETGEQVALKFLRNPGSAESALPRMRRELRLARDLGHPNIVRVHELIEDSGCTCLVMEFVPGITLKQAITDGGAMDCQRATVILHSITSALAAVHTAGIVHRDLKPHNVMMNPDGLVKLLDFGLAKTHDSTGLTATGTILGTPDYMSPEQVDGRPADERSDVYSLGVIAWELLMGATPFQGDTPLAVALQHVRSRIPSVDLHRPEVPPRLASLISRMTEPDPNKRPSTAEAVLLELEGVEGGREGITRWNRRQRNRTSAVIASIVVPLVITASWVGWGLLRNETQAPTDPFADGVVHVAVSTRPNIPSAVRRLFLQMVARTAVDGWHISEIEGQELEPELSTNLPHLAAQGIEHLIRLELHGGANRDNPGRLLARIVSTGDGRLWRSFESTEFTALEIEGAERLGRMVGDEYRLAVLDAIEGSAIEDP